MLKLATLIENPGEPLIDSRYHNHQELKHLGYNGVVVYPTTALSGIQSANDISSAEYKRWVNSHFQRVDQEILSATEAGLDVYLFYDMLVLPQDIVNLDTNAITCKNRAPTICPASAKAYDLSIQALNAHLNRWPKVTGIVLRFGDSDAPRLPFLVGNDIYSPYCPRCSSLTKLDRITQAINLAHQTVVNEHSKRLIVRAWNVRPNGLHDSVELAKKLVDKLPAQQSPDDDKLIISFKFTNTDFWRYQSWNQSSQIFGQRPIMYEFQCQREFEGKGCSCNWQFPIWQQGAPEVVYENNKQGLANIKSKVNFAGSLTWVRGGGWGGPFINNESWIDANVYAAPRLTDNPDIDANELAKDWITERLHIDDLDAIKVISSILINSHETVRRAIYIQAYASSRIDSWHPNADWIQDDTLDAEALARVINKLPENELDNVVAEKKKAILEISNARKQLQQLPLSSNQNIIEPLVSSLIYIESLIETVSHLIEGLIAHRRYKTTQIASYRNLITQRLFTAQTHWNHHTQRVPTLPGSPTPFREKNFWELTQTILSEIQST